MKDFYAELSTGRWPVQVSPFVGATCHTHAIVIVPTAIHSKEYLDTCIHETLHATNDIIPEPEVVRMAKDIAEVLWKIGYRLPKGKS